jgi:hypothetical protein
VLRDPTLEDMLIDVKGLVLGLSCGVEELGKTIDVLLIVIVMMEGRRKAQDHEGQKPFDSGVIV